VHLLLYVCLFVQPLTGYLGSAYSGYPVKFFVWTLPAWAGADATVKDAMSGVHLVNSWVLVAALALHLAGSAKHALIDRDGSFRRIWPWSGPARDPAVSSAGD
jgi:cytochrome b561